jgi:hypothetical protein
MAIRGLIMAVLGLLWAMIVVLVGGRFLALLVDANRDSEIVQRLLRHSDFWVKPFFGILDLTNETVRQTGGIFEVASFIALIVYVVAGLIVFALANQPFAWWGGGMKFVAVVATLAVVLLAVALLGPVRTRVYALLVQLRRVRAERRIKRDLDRLLA